MLRAASAGAIPAWLERLQGGRAEHLLRAWAEVWLGKEHGRWTSYVYSTDPKEVEQTFGVPVTKDAQGNVTEDGPPVPFTKEGAGESDPYTAFFEFLVPGTYRVELQLPPREGETEPPFSFDLDGDNPVEVEVENAGDADAGFTITCAYVGDLSPCGNGEESGD